MNTEEQTKNNEPATQKPELPATNGDTSPLHAGTKPQMKKINTEKIARMKTSNNSTLEDQQNVLKKSLPALEKLCTALAVHILDRKASVLGRPYIMAGSLVMKAQLGEFEGHTEELGALLHELKGNVEGFWASLPKELPNKLATLLKTAQAVTPAYGSNRATDKPSAA